MKRLLWMVVVAALTSACAPSFRLTLTTAELPRARAPDCGFQVVALPPAGELEEIATLRWRSGAAVDDPAEFKRVVAADVCRVGGELVLTEINGWGQYVRGVVLRRR